jgi:Ala-tRNA(Pro) deacylase
MQGERVRRFLREQAVAFEAVEHPRAVGAQSVAKVEHESGWRVAKPVMLRIGGDLAMAVVPAPVRLDLSKVKMGLGREDIALASETEYALSFPDCELGAEPIFGNLYGMRLYVDRALLNDPYVVFRDGTHQGTLRVSLTDYLRVTHAVELDMGVLPPNIPRETTLWGEQL